MPEAVIAELEGLFALFRPRPAATPAPVIVHAPASASIPTPSAGPAPPAPAAGGTSIIPDDSLTFIEDEKDGSPAYYVAHYEHWDWPGGISGATCGVGYDCGQVRVTEAEADWTGIVSPETVAHIVGAVGFQGARAQAFVEAHRNEIAITWDQAVLEFKTREVPKWIARIRAVVPNFDLLPPDSKGSILSLSYNRGTGGYDDPGNRDLEMREIKAAMMTKNFEAIPAYIESMARLWPSVPDLQRRRAHEAALFRKGLASGAVA